MSTDLTTFPYINIISSKNVPFFPGAYISRGAIGGGTGGANGLIPIYTSMPNFTDRGMTDILNDKDAQVLVLPGFSIQLYPETFYNSTVSTIDNSGGTDILFRNASLAASSCKLFYKFPSGSSNEISSGSIINVTVTTSPSITPTTVIYNSTSYRLYSFTTVGTGTFSVTSATDVSALVLLVAGGGAGGSPLGGQESAGGGGAGGVAIGTINIPRNVTHNCTVGNGGQSQNATGGDSTLTNTSNSQVVTVKGGGGGAYVGNGQTAGSGGSGGGANAGYGKGFNIGGVVTGTSTIAGITNYYGNNGGSCWGTSGADLGGGGGGGATSAGGNAYGAYTQIGGNGGSGYTWPVNSIVYAGGGGAGSGANTGYVSVGGSGGGGNGGTSGINFSTSGAANRGGGGGGGFSYSDTWSTGGSGIIIVAIPTFAFLPA